jgi:hypothetical protein
MTNNTNVDTVNAHVMDTANSRIGSMPEMKAMEFKDKNVTEGGNR